MEKHIHPVPNEHLLFYLSDGQIISQYVAILQKLFQNFDLGNKLNLCETGWWWWEACKSQQQLVSKKKKKLILEMALKIPIAI